MYCGLHKPMEKMFFALTIKSIHKNKINKKTRACVHILLDFFCGVTDVVIGIKLCDIIQHVDYIS